MGVQLTGLVPVKKITLEELAGKKIAIDAFNALYQFITTIRQRDGTPLMDSAGRITSHLSGLFYRTVKLIEAGIRPVYVFDGMPPKIKLVRFLREERKEEAKKKLEKAIEEGDEEEIRKYAMQAARLEPYMVEDAKKLLSLMGIPWVQAPSEGEAQAAFMAASGAVHAAGSQDYDALLFGAPRLVRNLTITGKRKLPGKDIYVEVSPEEILLEEVLKTLKLTREELIIAGILMGTDFNPGGIKGIGPKKAVELARKIKTPERIKLAVKWPPEFPEPEEIFEFFLNPPVTERFDISFKSPDEEGIIKFMVEEHDFNEERIRKALSVLKRKLSAGAQQSLSQWF